MGVRERRAAASVALSFEQLGKGQSEGGQASGEGSGGIAKDWRICTSS